MQFDHLSYGDFNPHLFIYWEKGAGGQWGRTIAMTIWN